RGECRQPRGTGVEIAADSCSSKRLRARTRQPREEAEQQARDQGRLLTAALRAVSPMVSGNDGPQSACRAREAGGGAQVLPECCNAKVGCSVPTAPSKCKR